MAAIHDKAAVAEWLKQRLTERRFRHVLGVVETGKRLARRYGADEEKAETAALFHDSFRDEPGGVLKRLAEACGVDEKYRGNRNLSHGKVAAAFMEAEYGVADQDVLNAVKYHTTGRAGMSALEKVIYLADAIEPSRDYPGVEELRRIAESDLDLACERSLENSVRHIEAKGEFMDEDTLNALAWLKGRRGDTV
ncbi:MAG: bis(5'-nucleosyl)-tetraphosphatase (symmetrical) YqeK [Clostridiales Family XIII bacterium]|jgi:predicted HD superfamily hydrolase involved in NAD metabolism|nr:bis(5'-nucleosyl)-tetraphosphatase (symmetrical) YqeK [Clostridiales Family XIII bacterium]